MSIVAIGSAKASPGATSLAVGLGLCWKATTNRQVVLLEADADGGVLAAQYGMGLSPSLVELSGAARRDLTTERLMANCQSLAGQLSTVVSPGSTEAVTSALGPLTERLTDGLDRLKDIDAIVDVGRIRPHSPAGPLIARCDLLVMVARPRFDELVPLIHRARNATAQKIPAVLACVGDQPYPPSEIAEAAELDLLGVVAYEPRIIRVLAGGLPNTPRQRQLPLWRTLADLTERIQQRIGAAYPQPTQLHP